MQPSVPVPTDNVYKFVALLGLALTIAAALGVVYHNDQYNELAYNNYLDLEMLKAKEVLSKDDTIRKTVLEGKVKIN